MAIDVYQPCPFCVDKKRKFCCADIAEDMEKVGRLTGNGQQRAAMKILDKLAVSHPNTVWNEATRAMLLLAEERSAEAKEILEKLHTSEPDNQAVLGLLATSSFATDGYDASKENIWRAFRKATSYGDLISSLALGIASEMYERGKFLSARQHLTLAMRFAPQQDKQSIFLRMLEFDGNAEIPYPLRSLHSLRDVSGSPEREEISRKAMRLAERGCFGPAAERFAALARETPDDPAVEYNFALCKAWEGDDEVAAEAFGRAALAEPDLEIAAEYAALEQFLRAGLEGGSAKMISARYRVPIASKLISDLDGHPRFVRVKLPVESENAAGVPDAVFELIDRSLPESAEGLSPENLPRAVGQIAVFGSTDEGPRAMLAALEGPDIEIAKALVREAAADVAFIDEQEDSSDVSVPRNLTPLLTRLAFPAKTSIKMRRELERRNWEQSIDRWLEIPQDALLGKSPSQAAGDEGLRVPLAGSVYVFDAFCVKNRYRLDINALRRRLGLPEVALVEAKSDLPLNTFSAIQLHRLPVAELDDRQLAVVLNRALLVHHGRFLESVLTEAAKRSLSEIDANRLYQSLADLAGERGDMEGAMHWVEEGRKVARTGDHPFEDVFRWDSRELGLRLEDPSSPDLQPFIRRMAAYYGPKIPRFTEYLGQILQSAGIEPPSVLEPVGATDGGGLWTPEQATGGTEKKLWIPGT